MDNINHIIEFDLSTPAKYVSGGWFSSDGVWLHPRRRLDTYVLLVGIKGAAYIKTENNVYTLTHNDVLILPSGLEHYGYKPSYDLSYLWFHFQAESGSVSTANRISVPVFMKCMAHSRLVQLGIQLLHVEQTKYSSPLATNYQLSSMLLEISEQFHQQSTQNSEGNPSKIYKIQEWIRINSQKNLTLNQIAEKFHYNKNYLCRVFKKATGYTVQKYITMCKLETAKKVIMTDDIPVKQIAKISGFSDEKYLMRVFRQYEGMTFGEFKNAYCRVHFNKK